MFMPTHLILLPLLRQNPEIELIHDGLRNLRFLNVMYSLIDLANGSFGSGPDQVSFDSGHIGSTWFGSCSDSGQLIFDPVSFSWKENWFKKKMFGLGSVRFGFGSIRMNFRSIIPGISSGRILVHSVRVIRVGSLLRSLLSNVMYKVLVIVWTLVASLG